VHTAAVPVFRIPGSDDASLTQSLSHFLFPYLGVDTLSASEWAESRVMEEFMGESHSRGMINHLPPTHLRDACAAAANSPPSLTVAEIGVGGGRVASRVYPHVRRLYCFDIAAEMLDQAQAAIARKYQREQAAVATPVQDAGVSTPAEPSNAAAAACADSAVAASATSAPSTSTPGASSAASSPRVPPHVSFHLLSSAPAFPAKYHHSCDFVYCFDVLPHCDLHTISGYFASIRTLLKPCPDTHDAPSQAATADAAESAAPDVPCSSPARPHPRAFLHVANLCAPLGWSRFSKQSRYTAGGFYFLSPDIVRQLAHQHGYRIIQQSTWANAYVPPPSAAAAGPLALESNLYYQRDLLFVLEMI